MKLSKQILIQPKGYTEQVNFKITKTMQKNIEKALLKTRVRSSIFYREAITRLLAELEK